MERANPVPRVCRILQSAAFGATSVALNQKKAAQHAKM
jgi:hypothetical protein